LIGHIEIALEKSPNTVFEFEITSGPGLTWSKSARLDVVFVAQKQVSKTSWVVNKYAAEIARLPGPPKK